MSQSDSPKTYLLPLLPLRDIVIFPHTVMPLFVGRKRSIAAVEAAMEQTKEIVLAAQRDARENDPNAAEVFSVGTCAEIKRLLRLPDGTVKVFVGGLRRVKILNFIDDASSLSVEVEDIAEQTRLDVETEALSRALISAFETYVKLNKQIDAEILVAVQAIDEADFLVDTIAAHLSLKVEQKQELLEVIGVETRMEMLLKVLQEEIEILQTEKRIRTRVKRQMERGQREYYLNEQMQAIQKELGEQDEFQSEILEVQQQIAAKEMSAEANERLERELRKLKMMAPLSAEATVVRNYIDWVIALPWSERSEEELNIERAAQILEEDHYGLDKIKQRIIEHLAVLSLVGKLKGPILCFVGPPGVGKTSLGRSIARATGRNFVRLSLGGVRDEAEIRGHRRTYIGALPGKIIQHLRRAGTSNPVFLLDEVDKMSTDFRGDPSSALLEVLDPEQNDAFNDHYLDLDYDLSDVMFITTANSLADIPLPLRDRMEIIELPGYTDEEKLSIARRYLVPKQLKANGLAGLDVTLSDGALLTIVNHYSKEAGVRDLERQIAAICRKLARAHIADPKNRSLRVTRSAVSKYLGVPKYRVDKREETDFIGMVNGLAVTSHGGELLSTEVTVMPGKGKLLLTGKLGDVMQESAQAALSYLRSRASSLGLDPDFYQGVEIHVHCPEGAIPKDGPSAGIAIATAMASALLQIPVRREVAMTGEITLRGRVLEIGGLKDKALAAFRSEVQLMLVPQDNEKDIKEIPLSVRRAVEIVPVSHMDDVLRQALRLRKPSAFLSEPSTALDWRLTHGTRTSH
ncbi:MAG: endopeptidase La [Deltaproteobacteria bacterium]|nr:endopeptidase La [Deltaproteobacteria bacterium]